MFFLDDCELDALEAVHRCQQQLQQAAPAAYFRGGFAEPADLLVERGYSREDANILVDQVMFQHDLVYNDPDWCLSDEGELVLLAARPDVFADAKAARDPNPCTFEEAYDLARAMGFNEREADRYVAGVAHLLPSEQLPHGGE